MVEKMSAPQHTALMMDRRREFANDMAEAMVGIYRDIENSIPITDESMQVRTAAGVMAELVFVELCRIITVWGKEDRRELLNVLMGSAEEVCDMFETEAKKMMESEDRET